MLSLLHPGCEKYGGQRCYSVIRLDCCASSCQRTARRAGNRHNFTRLLCDPVATGPQTPLHLSDSSTNTKQTETQTHVHTVRQALNTLSHMGDVHYGIRQIAAARRQKLWKGRCDIGSIFTCIYWQWRQIMKYSLHPMLCVWTADSMAEAFSVCLPHMLLTALLTPTIIYLYIYKKWKHDWTKLLTSCVSL